MIAEMSRIENTRKEVCGLIHATQAKLMRLQAIFDWLRDKKEKLAERELRNIEELESDERTATSNDLLFDVSSESFEIPQVYRGWSGLLNCCRRVW